jgi:hypothetical protein
MEEKDELGEEDELEEIKIVKEPKIFEPYIPTYHFD